MELRRHMSDDDFDDLTRLRAAEKARWAVKQVENADLMTRLHAAGAEVVTEAFGVLAEEVDELAEASGLEPVVLATSKLWAHVKVNQKLRDLPAMRAEAIQVAAMALRFVMDICDGGRGCK